MKTINKKAAAVFSKLIAAMNGEQHLKIDNTEGAFMPIIIERLQSDVELAGRSIDIYSLAHYYKQNGDLVPDPDMTFAVSRVNQSYIWPLTYQDYRVYQEGLFIENDSWKINKRLQKDHAVFSGIWLENIKQQQDI